MNTADSVRTLIIDDEQDAREILHYLLKKEKTIQLVGEAHSVQSGMEAILKHDPELIFLDIQMQDGTGFDLLSRFSNPKFRTVFVTAHDDFAIKAFKCNALDYLLKPVCSEDLTRVLQKVKNQRQPDWVRQVSGLLSVAKEKKIEKLLLPTSEGLNVINLSEIISITSDGSYSHIYLKNDERLTVSKAMKEMEELLDAENFLRVHQSHLVNLAFVKKLLKDEGGLILMSNETKIPLARRRKEEFLERLMKFIQ